MVQILEAPRSFGARMSDALLGAMDERAKLEGQKELAQEKLLGEQEKEGRAQAKNLENERIMAEYYGPEFAQVWAIQSDASKASMMGEAREVRQRGGDVRDIIKKYAQNGEKRPDPIQTQTRQGEDLINETTPDGMFQGSEFDDDDEDIFEKEPPVDTSGMSPAEIVRAQEARKARIARRKETQEARSFTKNQKYLEYIADAARGQTQRKVALMQQRAALENGDFNSFRNAAGEMLGLEILKTSSAQIVNSANKQFLMASLKDVTGRPNQFLERQIVNALINPLYTDDANWIIQEGLEGITALQDREIEIAQALEEKYTSRGKEVPRNYQKMVKDELRKEARIWEKEYEQKVKDRLGAKRKELPSGKIEMRNDKGKIIHVPPDRVDDVLNQGGTY